MPKKKSKTLAQRVDEQWTKVKENLGELVDKAGIAEKVDKPANHSHLWPYNRDAVTGTERFRQEIVTEQRIEFQSYRRRLRPVIFKVDDDELRRNLMDGFNQSEQHRVDWFQARLDEELTKLNAAKARGGKPLWWLWSALSGVLAVYLGQEWYGTAGAVAGAVVAYFGGRGLEADHISERDYAIRSAKYQVNSLEADVDDLRSREPLFSVSETIMGVEDARV